MPMVVLFTDLFGPNAKHPLTRQFGGENERKGQPLAGLKNINNADNYNILFIIFQKI